MILVDANILIYAVNRDADQHRKARNWLEQALSGTTEIGFAWIVILAFIRVTTRAGIMARPLHFTHALSYVDGWLSQSNATLVSPGERHWPIFRNLLSGTGSAGNLTSDVHLAALAVEYGAEIYSADYDFRRFTGITHINPLEER
ncbi:MAG: type II toxin-antitoxin system VapC family toxin [Gammaproteobacteria bacterium]|nr:type II toxin-antitoxin system VapC family toxin [Gammaproteobacteria bacterium]MDE0284592.1 type II toxin-antitoxin system VapC family toxin [Gammaproteobacteria bacterium]MDE0512683.1 type II toxin-antitoxin system VapC family toxin [Gammaproteobacteria bacterium]